jgi:predicted DNA-binding antitoxin AbrB/MazE fold protein
MTYLGHCENGVIKLNDGVTIAEGAVVRVEVLASNEAEEQSAPAPRTLAERYKSIIGKAKGLPADFAEQHDHYIHGTPKH